MDQAFPGIIRRFDLQWISGEDGTRQACGGIYAYWLVEGSATGQLVVAGERLIKRRWHVGTWLLDLLKTTHSDRPILYLVVCPFNSSISNNLQSTLQCVRMQKSVWSSSIFRGSHIALYYVLLLLCPPLVHKIKSLHLPQDWLHS